MKKKTVALMSVCLILSLSIGNISMDNQSKAQSFKPITPDAVQNGVQEDEELAIVEDELIVTLDANVEVGEVEKLVDDVAQDYEVLSGDFEINDDLPAKKKERLRKYLENKEYNTIVSVNLKENKDVDEVKEELESIDEIEDVEYNYEVKEIKADGMPTGMDDPFLSEQYYLENIDVATAWDAFEYGEYAEVWVAVIDSGLCIENPDFKGVYLKKYSVDVTKSDDNYKKLVDMSKPYVGDHGTMVAGVIAAKGNKKSIVGVASGYTNDICKIMAIKAWNNERKITYKNIVKAIQYAIENGAEVINLSYGTKNEYEIEKNAVKNAIEAGITVVASMGNYGLTENRYPADYDNVISVAATTKDNKLADFSNYGHQDICAPGVGIYTTGINSDDWTISTRGTSLATPIVSATAAMIKSINYNLSSSQIEDILYKTATDIGSSKKFGNGLVNAGYAVQMAKYKGLRTVIPKIKSVTETSVGNVSIKWKEMQYAEGYCISRATSKNGTYKRIGTVDASKNEVFVDKTVKEGETYYYKVRGYVRYQAGAGTVVGKTVGYSKYSDIVSIKVK